MLPAGALFRSLMCCFSPRSLNMTEGEERPSSVIPEFGGEEVIMRKLMTSRLGVKLASDPYLPR